MRKNVLKLITVLLVSNAICFCLAGCSQNTNNATTQQKNTGKKYNISWTAYQMVPTEKDGDLIKYFDNLFNVDLDVWNLDYSHYADMLNLRLATGDIPDMFRMQSPNDLLRYVDQGVLSAIPLDVLKKYAPNIMNLIDKNAPGFLNYGKVNGKLYAIPAINTGNIFRKPLVYRKDWMEKVGITKTPDTLADFEKLMYAFAKDDPDGDGKNDTYGLSDQGFYAVYGAFGIVPDEGYFNIKDGQAVYGGTAPEMKQALALLHKWYSDGVIDPNFVTGENTGGYWALSQAYINGRIGFTSEGNYYHWIQRGAYTVKDANGKEKPCDPGADAKAMEAVNPNAVFAFGLPLLGPNGDRGIKQYNELSGFYGIGILAGDDPGKMDKVLQMMDYISANPDPKIMNVNKNGIEGKEWEWANKEKTKIKILPPYDKDANYKDEIGGDINITVPTPVSKKDPQVNWGYQNQFDKYGIQSQIQIVTPSLAKYGSNLAKMRQQAYTAIIDGEEPIDYFDEFVKEYNAAGGTSIVNEANAWYQENK